MLPRESLLLTALAGSVKVFIKTGIADSLQPTLVGEAITPAIKTRSLLPCQQQCLAYTAVTAGENSLNRTGFGIMVV